MGMLKRGNKFTPTQLGVMAIFKKEGAQIAFQTGSILALKIWTDTNTNAFFEEYG